MEKKDKQTKTLLRDTRKIKTSGCRRCSCIHSTSRRLCETFPKEHVSPGPCVLSLQCVHLPLCPAPSLCPGRVAKEPEFVFLTLSRPCPFCFSYPVISLFSFLISERDLIHSFTQRCKGLRRFIQPTRKYLHFTWKLSFEQEELKYRNGNRVFNLSNSFPQAVFLCLKIRFCRHVSDNLRNVFSVVSFPGQFLCQALLSEAQTMLLPISPLGQSPAPS